jgi:hypothetical protein
MKSKKNSRKNRRGSSKQPVPVTAISPIPVTKQALIVKGKLLGRVITDSDQATVTRGNLLSLVTMATTTTQVARLFMSVILRRIRIWQVNSTSSDPLGMMDSSYGPSVLWESDHGPITMILRPQMGADVGSIDTKPPKNSLAGYWSTSNVDETDILFRFSALANACIQVEFEARINDSTVGAITGVSAGRTAGEVYYSLGSSITFLGMSN